MEGQVAELLGLPLVAPAPEALPPYEAPLVESEVEPLESTEDEILSSLQLLLAQRIQDAAEEEVESVDADALALAIISAGRGLKCEGEPINLSRKISHLIRVFTNPFGPMLDHTIFSILRANPAAAARILSLDMQRFAVEPDERTQIRALFYKALKEAAEAEGGPADAEVRQLVLLLERSIYNNSIKTCQTLCIWSNPMFASYYSEKATTLYLHLRGGSSISSYHAVGLARKLFSGQMLPEQVGNLAAAELCPLAFAPERSIIDLRSKQEVQQKTSSLWPCPQCKARSCTYIEVQDRSADEPASIYCTCTVCNFPYKGA